jgi:hypothetical protein
MDALRRNVSGASDPGNDSRPGTSGERALGSCTGRLTVLHWDRGAREAAVDRWSLLFAALSLAQPATAETIDFDALGDGEVVTDQFAPGATFSSIPDHEVRVYTTVETHSPQNAIGGAVLGGNLDLTREVIVDFAPPAEGVSFWASNVNDTGTIAKVEVFESGVSSGDVDVVGGGQTTAFVDLSAFGQGTRLHIHDITDSFGLGFDDFSYTPGAVGGCPDLPLEGCVNASKVLLKINERRPGHEKLDVKLGVFESRLELADFGDPVDGSTRYDLCLYDVKGSVLAGWVVDRGGDLCRGKPCWKALGIRYRFKDPLFEPDGVGRIELKQAKARSTGKVTLKGANTNRAQNLPTGVSSLLAGQPGALVQLLASDAQCFHAGVVTKRADPDYFVGRQPD